MISMVLLSGTLVNKFSTLSEANIPLLGLSVCWIWINSCVYFILYLLGKYGVISYLIVLWVHISVWVFVIKLGAEDD